MRWFSGRADLATGFLLSLRQFIQERKRELRAVVIFLLLIFLPSGLLGYLSWRAVQSDKLLSEQKIIESYRQFVRLAAREINADLENVQARLQASIEKAVGSLGRKSAVEQLDSLRLVEPLVFSCVLLTSPGQVAYPPEFNLQRPDFKPQTAPSETVARDYDLFTDLKSRGEELEYRANDLDGAIGVYRQALTEISAPQLHAIAYSLLGRAQTKKGDWEEALQTYEKLLKDYPEVRDLNKMYLRFLAQYQISICLDSLGRDREAIAALLRMNKDLLERSDTINNMQYAHFKDWIETSKQRILSMVNLEESDYYRQEFESLEHQDKKRISDKYFVQLFDQELRELVIKRKPYRPIIRYFSGQADNEPFLLGYLTIPDQSSQISGLLGFRVNLAQLRERILPSRLIHLKTSESLVLAILDSDGNYVIGPTKPNAAPLVTHALDSPFKFWQVGLFPVDEDSSSPLTNLRTILWLWLISVLLFSILLGAYIFIRYARQEARLSELKSSFVSRVSHELRTPVTSIKMLAEHLEMQMQQKSLTTDRDLRSRIDQYLTVIRRESDRLGRLIENILDFSKIERGVKQYQFEYEMPTLVLQKAIDSFRPHAEAQGFTIKNKMKADLPELYLDSDAITQAILNLLSNAVKYSEKEKIIAVRAFRDHDHVCIEVEDHGIGISASQLSRVFDEFYRVDQKLNTIRQGGMGLGLTLIKHIVQAHGGTIKVRSEEGSGSTFIVTLPIPVDDRVKKTESVEKSNHAKNRSVVNLT